MVFKTHLLLLVSAMAMALVTGAPHGVDAKNNPGNPVSAGVIGPAAAVHIDITKVGSDLIATVTGTCGSLPVNGSVNLGSGNVGDILQTDFIDYAPGANPEGNGPFHLVWGVDPVTSNLVPVLQACYNSPLQLFAMQFESVRNFSNDGATASLDAVMLRSVTQ